MENDRFILNRNSDVKVIYIGTGQFQLASGNGQMLYSISTMEYTK